MKRFTFFALSVVAIAATPVHANGFLRQRQKVVIRQQNVVERQKVIVKEQVVVERQKVVVQPILAVNSYQGYAAVVQPVRSFLRVQSYGAGYGCGQGLGAYSGGSEVEALRRELELARLRAEVQALRAPQQQQAPPK